MSTLTTCIYCGKPLDGSKEHIIPNSLNGRLTSRDIICSTCNNYFGSKLDPTVKVVLNPLLLVFGLKNASGTLAEAEGGQKYVVNKDLVFAPQKPAVSEILVDGKRGVSIEGTQKQVYSVISKINKKLLGTGVTLQTKEVKQHFVPNHPKAGIPFKIDTGDNRLALCIWKIAVEFAANLGLSLEILQPHCDKVYNLENVNVKYCNFKNEVRDFETGEISHSVLLRSEGPVLYCYIELFSIVCGFVVLDTKYKGKKVDEQFRQDALTGAIIRKPIKLKKSILELLQSARKNDNFEFLANSSFDRIRDRNLTDAMETGLSSIMKLVKDKQANGMDDTTASHLYIEEATKYIAELDIYHFPYTIADLGAEVDEDAYNLIHSNVEPEKADAFIEENKSMIGFKVKVDTETYTVDRLEKRNIRVRVDKPMANIQVILIDTRGKEFQCPIKEFWDLVGAAVEKIEQKKVGN
jgi:hypothetical protein